MHMYNLGSHIRISIYNCLYAKWAVVNSNRTLFHKRFELFPKIHVNHYRLIKVSKIV